MNAGHELVEQVYAAKTDTEAADRLIRQYMGFIRAETAKYIHRAPIEGQDEELSIVLLAFYEAILGYEKKRGAFLSYASRGIRSRIIDHYRKEKKHINVISLHEPVQDDDNEIWKIDQLEDPENRIEKSHHISATRDEIQEYEKNCWSLEFPFRMWRITARGRNAPCRHAGECCRRQEKIPNYWMSCSVRKNFQWRRFH